MRIYVKLFFGGACVSVLGILTASCASTGCEGPGTCAPSGVGDADGGGGGGDGGADVVAPPGCDLTKSPKDSPACVDDAVGVFVSPTGDDGAAGKKGAPVKSIAKGVELAASRGLPRVYVCEGTYAESIALAKSVSIYGGFSCADFGYTGARPTVQPADGTVPALDLSASNLTIADLTLVGPNLGAPSSLAVRAVSAKAVVFERTSLEARSGAGGDSGTRIDFTAFPSQADLNGSDASGAAGGLAKQATCPGGLKTGGGKGGDNGFSGEPGVPALGGGAGGIVGQSCAGTGTGGDGAVGVTNAGAGAKKTGTLVQNAWMPEAGGQGSTGAPGQGGGGGQGVAGGGGGGGGAGGCGGAGGGGGNGGGASIVVLSIDSDLVFRASGLVSGAGGLGGAGLAGQQGQQTFGFGGNKTGGGCGGGNGAKGANGEAGGGGAGGVSVGILYKGSKPSLEATTMVIGPFGLKGAGGAPGINDGVDGVKAETLEAPP